MQVNPIKEEKARDLKELILSEYKKGNIVVSTIEGLETMPLKEIVKQHTQGLLYDLNRDQVTILSSLDDSKWINDYASSMVIVELKNQIEELTKNKSE